MFSSGKSVTCTKLEKFCLASGAEIRKGEGNDLSWILSSSAFYGKCSNSRNMVYISYLVYLPKIFEFMEFKSKGKNKILLTFYSDYIIPLPILLIGTTIWHTPFSKLLQGLVNTSKTWSFECRIILWSMWGIIYLSFPSRNQPPNFLTV